MNRGKQALHDTTRDFILKRTHGCATARQRVMTILPVFRHHFIKGLKMTLFIIPLTPMPSACQRLLLCIFQYLIILIYDVIMAIC